ncbi:hypothetical protein AMEX_G13586 [Astyanax mexicanus]|uniref:Uncharacterized protein n=1 Tax=Astyanax mexicanus TaxID=7994 RepID=A0A8T2LRU4_ASTMX|nr:hypothetical protein AMEX_G13586 [Astyanax mexicanus]
MIMCEHFRATVKKAPAEQRCNVLIRQCSAAAARVQIKRSSELRFALNAGKEKTERQMMISTSSPPYEHALVGATSWIFPSTPDSAGRNKDDKRYDFVGIFIIDYSDRYVSHMSRWR